MASSTISLGITTYPIRETDISAINDFDNLPTNQVAIANTYSKAWANTPRDGEQLVWMVLTFGRSNAYKTQIACDWSNLYLYCRTYNNTSWTTWKKITTS